MIRKLCLTGLLASISLGLVVVFQPAWLGLRPTVPNPVRPAESQTNGTFTDVLASAWAPDENVPWNAALPLALISEATYSSGEQLRGTLAQWGLTQFSEHIDSTMYACVASNDRAVVVAFRGTDEIRDWLVNVQIFSETVQHGLVHSGFYRSMQTMRPRILELIAQHGGNHKPVWIVGHSLGGGLALAFSYSVLADGSLTPAGLVTFGQPLVVDPGVGRFLHEKFAGRYVRFVHASDIVARVLPTYAHCGNLVWLRDGDFQFERYQPPTPNAFTSRSMARGSGTMAASAEPPGPTTLSLEEFEQMKTELAPPSINTRSLRAKSTAQTGLPWIADHGMAGYIHWINEFSNRSARLANATDPAPLR